MFSAAILTISFCADMMKDHFFGEKDKTTLIKLELSISERTTAESQF